MAAQIVPEASLAHHAGSILPGVIQDAEQFYLPILAPRLLLVHELDIRKKVLTGSLHLHILPAILEP